MTPIARTSRRWLWGRSGAAAAFVSLVAAVAPALIPVSLPAQAPVSPRDAIVWHWFGDCAGRDSLALEVRFDGQPVYASTFPICQVRRSRIRPEPQQRLLEFRFNAVPRRFGPRSRATDIQSIRGNIWESGGAADAILLGVSFAAGGQVLLNVHLVARARLASHSERIRGLVISTRPVRLGDQTPGTQR
jgi:hypothetical protein